MVAVVFTELQHLQVGPDLRVRDEDRSRINIEMVTPLRKGSLDNPDDVEEAIQTILDGGVVCAQFRGVIGVWVRADNAEAVERALVNVKGGEVKPMVAMTDSETFLEMIDIEAVHPSLQHLVSDHIDFQRRLGAICIVGAPIRKDVANRLPQPLLSKNKGVYKMLNLDPEGNPHMRNFLSRLQETVGLFVGISSLNASGEREIAEINEALEYLKHKPDVTLLLTDPHGAYKGVKGSFPVIDLQFAMAIRDGHIPIWLVERIIGTSLDKGNMKNVKDEYPQLKDFNKFKNENHNPYAWRMLAIDLTTER